MTASFGDGLDVVYTITASADAVAARAQDIAIEQTVEVTPALCADPFVATHVVGRVVDIVPAGPNRFDVTLSYAGDVVGDEIPQLFSVVFGNVSLKAGVRVREVRPSSSLVARFPGPRFGISGLRDRLGVHDRPLVMGAVKPLGRTVEELAAFAGAMATGGLDLIKDDHGITDQRFAPFEARVAACAAAVAEANRRTGYRTLYCPTVTGPADRLLARSCFARDAGVGGLLISPLVAGPDFLRAAAVQTGLPVIAHPAMAGAFLASPDHGMAHGVLLGTLMRLAGADMVVFPGWGGRFPLTRDDCGAIDAALKCPLHGVASAMPVPAGGLTLERIDEMRALFGLDVTFLIGSAVYERSSDLVANAAHFRHLAACGGGAR